MWAILSPLTPHVLLLSIIYNQLIPQSIQSSTKNNFKNIQQKIHFNKMQQKMLIPLKSLNFHFNDCFFLLIGHPENPKIQLSTKNAINSFNLENLFRNKKCKAFNFDCTNLVNGNILKKIFSAFSLESNALKGPLWLAGWPAGWLARWLPQKLSGGST